MFYFATILFIYTTLSSDYEFWLLLISVNMVWSELKKVLKKASKQNDVILYGIGCSAVAAGFCPDWMLTVHVSTTAHRKLIIF